jgi:imidazole glycerol-phosphate synthase subunit HisH
VSAPAIAVVDYGMGNRRSVEKALDHVGARALVTGDHDELRAADGLVVPGVGAFPKAMANLRELGLDALIGEAVRERVPVLGICLGMQLLFDRSEELGGGAGLGLLPGEVRRLDTGGLKLPHIGWNLVTLVRSSPLTDGLPDACAFYHVHTFAPVPAREDTLIGTSEYGAPFASVVADPDAPVFGVQFHPEKSSAHGLRLLENFARVCAPVAA